jgi:hypothetical protein
VDSLFYFYFYYLFISTRKWRGVYYKPPSCCRKKTKQKNPKPPVVVEVVVELPSDLFEIYRFNLSGFPHRCYNRLIRLGVSRLLWISTNDRRVCPKRKENGRAGGVAGGKPVPQLSLNNRKHKHHISSPPKKSLSAKWTGRQKSRILVEPILHWRMELIVECDQFTLFSTKEKNTRKSKESISKRIATELVYTTVNFTNVKINQVH